MSLFQGQGTSDMGQVNLEKTDTEHVIPSDPESIRDIIEGLSARFFKLTKGHFDSAH